MNTVIIQPATCRCMPCLSGSFYFWLIQNVRRRKNRRGYVENKTEGIKIRFFCLSVLSRSNCRGNWLRWSGYLHTMPCGLFLLEVFPVRSTWERPRSCWSEYISPQVSTELGEAREAERGKPGKPFLTWKPFQDWQKIMDYFFLLFFCSKRLWEVSNLLE